MQNNQLFLTLLSILFIGLKLAKIINWSWLWILSPIWIPTVLVMVLMIIIILFKK